MFSMLKKTFMPSAEDAPPGRDTPMRIPDAHHVNGRPLAGPFPENMQQAVFGLGCFWGAEKLFWEQPGVYTTAVGYAGGHTANPTYKEVCSGQTGHNEVVLVVFDPAVISYEQLLALFWEGHNPTQGMRQGNDQGTQYRSGIYYSLERQCELAQIALDGYQRKLTDAGMASITTEILAAGPFYYAEDYHQQYLDKNPAGYCGMGGTGVTC